MHGAGSAAAAVPLGEPLVAVAAATDTAVKLTRHPRANRVRACSSIAGGVQGHDPSYRQDNMPRPCHLPDFRRSDSDG